VFTGIVREVGSVEAIERSGESAGLRVRAPKTAAATGVGESVSVSGVCLTAIEASGDVLSFQAVPETMRRSSLGRLRNGAKVNLEPAARAGEPVGGHIVQGHVDGVGCVRAVEREGDGELVEVELPPGLERYVVEKGSIAVEGVSLTVAAVGRGSFSVALVPHTLAATTLGDLTPGDHVNLEVDVLAKHVERLLEARGALS
jgi:riboflavin synthase